MDRLLNPYRPGAGTQPPALIGRDAIIDSFGVSLRRASAGMPGKGFSDSVSNADGYGAPDLLTSGADANH